MLGCATPSVSRRAAAFYSVVTVRGHSESAYCFYSQEAEDSERNDDDIITVAITAVAVGFASAATRRCGIGGEDSGRDDNLRPRQQTDDGSGGQFEPVPVSR